MVLYTHVKFVCSKPRIDNVNIYYYIFFISSLLYNVGHINSSTWTWGLFLLLLIYILNMQKKKISKYFKDKKLNVNHCQFKLKAHSNYPSN